MTVVPLNELPEFVRNVMATLAMDRHNTQAVVIELRGDLGAGKTTFVQALARQMGIRAAVQSPTYVLMKTYKLPETLNPWGQKRRFKQLIHIDAYRLEDPKEFLQLKPEEFLNDPGNLVVVEWPEKAEGYLPEPDRVLQFSADGVASADRTIEMQK